MSTRKKVMALANKMDVSIEFTFHDGDRDADAWAPKGKVFASNFCHCFVTNMCSHESTLAQFYDSVLYELNAGLEDCDQRDCDHCAND